MAPRKTFFTLRQKIEVINVAEREHLSVRKLGERFNISKTQAAHIVKHKDNIRKRWQSGENLDQKKRKLKNEAAQIDKMCFEWFVHARNQQISITGPLIKAKAKEIASDLQYHKFSASDGWLQKWRKRHNINFKCNKPIFSEDDQSEKNNLEQKLLIKNEVNEQISENIATEEFIVKQEQESDEEEQGEDFGSITCYEDALKVVKSLKNFSKGDFFALEHLKNLEFHFQNCFLQEKSKNC
ncbi:Tigger transposable element-derived protein 3-like Protein [Tribolium castaneum]|uniref:Tigger transposable element-derived protein 3-like Protein n=1 Tax=Tribolium castaneum TaxID=7070 RepID=D6WC05_TRICA|nr:Tigger transposable element-derived protein 3-like Protein [Tribolium castaneum]